MLTYSPEPIFYLHWLYPEEAAKNKFKRDQIVFRHALTSSGLSAWCPQGVWQGVRAYDWGIWHPFVRSSMWLLIWGGSWSILSQLIKSSATGWKRMHILVQVKVILICRNKLQAAGCKLKQGRANPSPCRFVHLYKIFWAAVWQW